MSNRLYIELVKVQPIAGGDPCFGVIASDSYGTKADFNYESEEKARAAYPSRFAVLEWVDASDEFAGTFSMDEKNVTLDSCSGIEFSGFDDDGSITFLK